LADQNNYQYPFPSTVWMLTKKIPLFKGINQVLAGMVPEI
jgi:hypothetical protein